MTSTAQFCRMIRERSNDHMSAGELLYSGGLYGQIIAVLRQELDSMVRVIFLLDKDLITRQHYISQTLNNLKWTLPGSRTAVTDRQMVELSDTFQGWTKSVYKLGCAFIHLSPLVDYRNENPFFQLPSNEIMDIKNHLNNYHGFPLSNDLNMNTIKPYLLKVLTKVSDNLEAYITNLERDQISVD